MSIHPSLALALPPDAAPAQTFGLLGGDVLVAVLGFAALFVVFGTRPLRRSGEGGTDAPGGCGACTGGACGAGSCPDGPTAASREEAP